MMLSLMSFTYARKLQGAMAMQKSILIAFLAYARSKDGPALSLLNGLESPCAPSNAWKANPNRSEAKNPKSTLWTA